jgi:hypothetical protein
LFEISPCTQENDEFATERNVGGSKGFFQTLHAVYIGGASCTACILHAARESDTGALLNEEQVASITRELSPQYRLPFFAPFIL